MKKLDFTIEELRLVVANNIGFAQVMRQLGYRVKGGNVKLRLEKLCIDNNINFSHFKGKSHGSSTIGKSLESILIINSTYTNLYSLKKRLVKEKILEYKCSICSIKEWNGKQLSLQLDHINGTNNDHRVQNIRFLCPNCHSQTDTYSGKNVNKSS